jgi:ribA/ribD-fused uncharacterized protein
MSETVINFYRVSEAYGEFSNFSPHPITLAGKRWPTTEHYFQAQKFEGRRQARGDPQGQQPDARRPASAAIANRSCGATGSR